MSKIRCPTCDTLIYKRNLKKHLHRKHSEEPMKDINARFYIDSECVDEKNGIYAVLKVSRGHSVPLHVQLKTWGEQHKVECTSDECQTMLEIAQRSGRLPFQCKHIRSVYYCKSSAETVLLEESSLSEIVEAKWFSEEKKRACLSLQQQANTCIVPLSVEISIGTPETKKFISVFEPKVSYYSRLGRVMVVYDMKYNSWHCPCAKLQHSCMHKYVAKWHLFQTNRDIFQSVQNKATSHQEHQPLQFEAKHIHNDLPIYPPKDQALDDMVTYILQHKKIPRDLPDHIRVSLIAYDYPRSLFPGEEFCQKCPGSVPLGDSILVTKKAKIFTTWSVIEDVATYCKRCPKCRMFYRYQEWKDHLHNFDDHAIFSIPLCLTVRSLLKVHTSVSRVKDYLEDFTGLNFPSSDTMLHAYLHFEALTAHEYRYSCVTCGDYPPVVIMDLHKKGVFKYSVNDIEEPPENFRGDVDIEKFWHGLSKEMICRGFVASGAQNPFTIKPSYHFWAPWIGKYTRQSDCVLNTEYDKRHPSNSALETAELAVTEERLQEELQKQKVQVIRNLCRECGLDSSGSRSDLLLRLSTEMKSRQTYDKLFEKIWGASGGWGVIMCPCGIVYSLKFNLRAESPRDFVDLLLSWKHIPNVVIYDFARGLATHGNLRVPEIIPFRPYEGRLAEPTEEIIELAKCGKLQVSLPWLVEKPKERYINGHPLTGSSDHYVLSDRFHEGNSKDSRDVLRRITLVPQLAGKINSQVAEQLFAKMRKNNYFLNMSQPSTHLFQMRMIIEQYNEKKNKATRKKLMKTFGAKISMNMHGQATLEHADSSFSVRTPMENKMTETSLPLMTPHRNKSEPGMACKIANLSASRACWDCLPSEKQSALLEWALQAGDENEIIVEVGKVVLKRKDFWTLGHNEQLEATIANCCFEVISLVAQKQGLDVWCVDAYIVATWLPPNDQDPSLSYPTDISIKDFIVIPAWKPGHWMLCLMKPKDKHIMFLDSTNPYGFSDDRYVKVFRKMSDKIATGKWQLLENKNIPQQMGGVDCGVFMLMYALHFILGEPFDFTAFDIIHIRKWWTLILLENFGFFTERSGILQEKFAGREQLMECYSEVEVKPIKDKLSFGFVSTILEKDGK